MYQVHFFKNTNFNNKITTITGVYDVNTIKSKDYYKILVANKFEIPIIQQTWDDVLNVHLLETDWENIYVSKIVDVHDAKLSEFNFKMLNNITVCRSNRFKWKKITSPLCIYCGKNETVKHIYFECDNVNNMWKEIGLILNCNIKWWHIVLGARGDNVYVKFRNLLYNVIVYALFKNWCKDMDNNVYYQVGNVTIVDCKKIILKDMFKWNSILKCTKLSISKISILWQKVIHKIQRQL